MIAIQIHTFVLRTREEVSEMKFVCGFDGFKILIVDLKLPFHFVNLFPRTQYECVDLDRDHSARRVHRNH